MKEGPGGSPEPRNSTTMLTKMVQQAGAEMAQAKLKLELDCIFIFCSFVFSRFGCVELVLWIHFCMFDRKDLFWYFRFIIFGFVLKVQI